MFFQDPPYRGVTPFITFLIGILTGFHAGCVTGAALAPDQDQPVVIVLEGAGDQIVDNAVDRLMHHARPTLGPVTVEWVDGLTAQGRMGETVFEDGVLVVRIQGDLSGFSRERLERYVKIGVLLHEWGHALSIGSGAVGDPVHDAMFGVGQARGYRALYGRR